MFLGLERHNSYISSIFLQSGLADLVYSPRFPSSLEDPIVLGIQWPFDKEYTRPGLSFLGPSRKDRFRALSRASSYSDPR